jgi:hypothetical protein
MQLMFPYLECTITFLMAVWVFETYIDYRQHQKYKEAELPKALVGIISEEKYLKAQIYGLDKSRFGFISDGISQILSGITLWYRWMPYLWNLSGRLLIFLSGKSTPSEVRGEYMLGGLLHVRSGFIWLFSIDITIVGLFRSFHGLFHFNWVAIRSLSSLCD